MSAAQLSLQGLRMAFGGIVAVDDVSFDVKPNTVHALIGPNGAGKTTVLNCISRFYTPQQGRITLPQRGRSNTTCWRASRTASRRWASRAVSRTWSCSASSPCSTTC